MYIFESFKEKYYKINEALGIDNADGTYKIPLNVTEINHFNVSTELIDIIKASFECEIALVGGAVRDLFYRFYNGYFTYNNISILAKDVVFTNLIELLFLKIK